MTKKQTNRPNKKTAAEYEQLGRMMENIYNSGFINENTAYKNSFLKGVMAGLGGVVGATIVVALLLWFLSFFNEVPLIGPIIEKTQATLDAHQ